MGKKRKKGKVMCYSCLIWDAELIKYMEEDKEENKRKGKEKHL